MPESLNQNICNAYKEGASKSSAEVKVLHIADLKFNPNLAGGYHRRTELEPDLINAWEDIIWAEHLVWVHPVWWGSIPAIMKGFIDRLFLPGMAFKYKENSIWWDKLLIGKSAHIITTMHQPGWYYRLVYARPSINALRKSTLHFCGVKPVNVTSIHVERIPSKTKIDAILKKVYLLGYERK